MAAAAAALAEEKRRKVLQCRQLGLPQMRIIPDVSLPQLLTKYAEPEQLAVLPGASPYEGYRKMLHRPTSQRLGQTTTSSKLEQGSSKGGALEGAKRALEEMSGMRMPTSSSAQIDAGLSPTWDLEGGGAHPAMFGGQDNSVCEFAGSRSRHPRLRWPRLARRQVANDDGAIDAAAESQEQAMAPGAESCAATLESPAAESSAPAEPASAKPAVRFRGKGVPKARAPLPRPAILPRVGPSPPVNPGTVATLHSSYVPEEEPLYSETTPEMLASQVKDLRSLVPPSSAGTMTSRSTVSSGSSRTVDRKWFMRVAPISRLSSAPHPNDHMSHASKDGTSLSRFASSNPEYLNFERWGIGDDYVESILSSYRCAEIDDEDEQELVGIRHANFSENQLTEKGVEALMERGLFRTLETLNLASNRLGKTTSTIAMEQIARCHSLLDLNLAGNELGDVVVERLCALLPEGCRQLEGLGLARCGLGASGRGGAALGRYVSSARRLSKLDLNWNSFHGHSAISLMQGVYANNVDAGGCLARINIAWNRLGSSVRNSQRKELAKRVAKAFASVFQDGQELFHLDLSYNNFNAEECAILAQGLRRNHTLFGIHLIGNEAMVDDMGFIIPWTQAAPGAPAGSGASASVSGAIPVSDKAAARNLQDKINAYVRTVPIRLMPQHPGDVSARTHWQESVDGNPTSAVRHNPSLRNLGGGDAAAFSPDDLQAEHMWAEQSARVQPIAGKLSLDCEAVQRDATCCWICEGWVEHKVTYTPGWSGPEGPGDTVDSVYALYSIDGFSRPTRLRRIEETCSRKGILSLGRRYNIRQRGSVSRTGTMERIPSKDERQSLQKQTTRGASFLQAMSRVIVRWVGVRMLPKTLDPVHIIFLVNGSATVAGDMPKCDLTVPKLISLPEDSLVGMDETDLQPQASWEVSHVNVVHAADIEASNKASATPRAVCVLEDPRARGELLIVPRSMAPSDAIDKAKEPWTFETSTFKEFKRDSEAVTEECFDMDWANSNITKILKTPDTRGIIHGYLRPKYAPIVLGYSQLAFAGLEDRRHAAGVSFRDFREYMSEARDETSGVVVDNLMCKLSDVDCMFVASNVVMKDRQQDFIVMPKKRLARFQFLEALIRVAMRRFLSKASITDPLSCMHAIENLVVVLRCGEDVARRRRTLHSQLFTEVCCVVYRDNLPTLQILYDAYRTMMSYPGRTGRFLSLAAWAELLKDIDITGYLPARTVGTAFVLGKEVRADETSSWRHMELSWAEFLVSLGAIVMIMEEYGRGNSLDADMLEDFFDRLEPLADRLRSVDGAAPRRSGFSETKASLMGLLGSFVRGEASDDPRAELDMQAVRDACSQESMVDKLRQLGVQVMELELACRALESQGVINPTVERCCDGLLHIKAAMQTSERTLERLQKLFEDADYLKSGDVEWSYFVSHLEDPARQRSLHMQAEDVEDFCALHAELGPNAKAERVDALRVVELYICLVDPAQAPRRGLRVLAGLLREADADKSGTLDLEEVLRHFGAPRVSESLSRRNLVVPDWRTLFQELDLDGSGDLDWEEIEQGMSAFWARGGTET